MGSEPAGHQKSAKRDKGDDQNRETYRGYRLRNSDGHSYPEDLQANVETNFFAWDFVERILGCDETSFGVEVDELLQNAVGLDRSPLFLRLARMVPCISYFMCNVYLHRQRRILPRILRLALYVIRLVTVQSLCPRAQDP